MSFTYCRIARKFGAFSKFLLHDGFGLGLITSTLSGTVLIGLLGIVLAH
jgi:uncharacterized membrane protein YjjB (DUF3815 family)